MKKGKASSQDTIQTSKEKAEPPGFHIGGVNSLKLEVLSKFHTDAQ